MRFGSSIGAAYLAGRTNAKGQIFPFSPPHAPAAGGGGGAWTLVDHNTGTAPGGSTGNSGTINSTGATLLLAMVGDGSIASGIGVTDSNANDWNSLTIQYNSAGTCQIFYSYAKSSGALSLGAGHYISVHGFYPAFSFQAWKGTRSSPTNTYDTSTGNTTAGGASTINPGPLTTGGANALVVTVFGGYGSSSDTINSSYIPVDLIPFSGGNNFDGSSAYILLTSAGSTDPQWGGNAPNSLAASIASFLP